jgi:PhnB protein
VADQTQKGPTGGLTPHIQIGDARAADAVDWYVRAFGGIELHRQVADDGKRLMHAHVLINGASLMLHDEFPEYVAPEDRSPAGGGGLTLHLQVDDVDAWFDRAVKAGARAAMAPADMFWGDRYAQVVDPFGYRWSIGAPLASR